MPLKPQISGCYRVQREESYKHTPGRPPYGYLYFISHMGCVPPIPFVVSPPLSRLSRLHLYPVYSLYRFSRLCRFYHFSTLPSPLFTVYGSLLSSRSRSSLPSRSRSLHLELSPVLHIALRLFLFPSTIEESLSSREFPSCSERAAGPVLPLSSVDYFISHTGGL